MILFTFLTYLKLRLTDNTDLCIDMSLYVAARKLIHCKMKA